MSVVLGYQARTPLPEIPINPPRELFNAASEETKQEGIFFINARIES